MISFRPYSRLQLTLTFALVAALTFYATASELSDPLISWASTNSFLRKSMVVSGPVVAVSASLTGGLAKSVAITATARRRLLFLWLIGPVFLVALSGYATGIAPLLIITTTHTSWGAIDLLTLASCILMWIAWSVLGFTIGHSIRFPLSVVISALIASAWIYLPFLFTESFFKANGESISFLSIAPLWLDFNVSTGFELVASTTVFFICLVSTLIVACAFFLKQKTVSVFIVPAILAVVGIAFQPHLIRADDVTSTCKVIRGSKVCLHPANAAAFSVVEDSFDRLADVLGDDGLPSIVGDISYLDYNAAYVGLYSDLGDNYLRDQTTTELARWSAGIDTCLTRILESSNIRQLTEEEDLLESMKTMAYDAAFADIGLARLGGGHAPKSDTLKSVFEDFARSSQNWTPQQAGHFIVANRESLQTCDTSFISEVALP